MMNCKPRVTKSSLYHIKKLYDDDYVRRQNKWYHDYLKGKGGYSKRIRFLKSIIGNISHSMILDLGCGVGTFAIEYAKLGNQTVGLDISPIAISAAKTNAKVTGVKYRSTFIIGNVSNYHFRAGAFDLIIAADIIEHLNQTVLSSTLNRCFEWLKPGGKFVIHTFPTRYYILLRRKYLSIALIPVLFLPERLKTVLIKLVYIFLSQFLFRIRFGESLDDVIKKESHCNPMDPITFKEEISNKGFIIQKYELLEEVLSPLSSDKPHFRFGERLIRKAPLLRPAIVVVCSKARNVCRSKES